MLHNEEQEMHRPAVEHRAELQGFCSVNIGLKKFCTEQWHLLLNFPAAVLSHTNVELLRWHDESQH